VLYRKKNGDMARNNVFKLSGNMALGSSDPYSNNDFDNIKSSLKLLKSKQPQRQQAPQPSVISARVRITMAVPIPPAFPSGRLPPNVVLSPRSAIQRLPKL
jgi:hypothetical protein